MAESTCVSLIPSKLMVWSMEHRHMLKLTRYCLLDASPTDVDSMKVRTSVRIEHPAHVIDNTVYPW